jgi:ABC-type nitrate/sulfonate/bicarbonate transport system substrate-binding protein
MTISRRTMLAAGAATAALPRFAIGQSMMDVTTIRSTAKSWIWMAEAYADEGGFFTKAGVKVSANASSRGTNMTALVGPSVDIEWGDPGEAMNAKKENLQFRTIGQTVGKFGSHVVVKKEILDKAGLTEASPLEKKIALLRGLRMGNTGPGGAPDNLLRWLSVHGGMDPNKDVRLVTIQGGGPGMVAAVSQGVIDGFCLSSPTADIAVSKFGCAYLFQMVLNPPPEFANYTYIICNTAVKTLNERREALVRYVTGLALSLRSIHDEPEKFKAFAIPYLELDPSIAESAYAGNSKMYYANPRLTEAQFTTNKMFINTANVSSGLDPMPDSLTFASMYDPSIAEEAMKRI